jgi:bifunctional non-homologous end joining protein LigD
VQGGKEAGQATLVIAMTLSRYQQKRDFKKTPEPRGKSRKAGSLYVIQKHAASHLHYDFRLQIGGVLKSWAVPKGPSLDPDVKRLAMHVEDHPVEYGGFEGTIPQGQYGGGTVMLWDQGTWEIDGDPQQQYDQGKLHFRLHGDKLRGEWVLVKRHGAATASDRGKEPWFLFKIRDDEAVPGDEDGILEREPNSAASGRTMEGIASGRKREWTSSRKSASAAANGKKTRGQDAAPRADFKTRKSLVASLAGAKRGPLPKSIKPQLATLVKEAPSGDEWFGEIKFDGYRMICHVDRREVKFFSRNGLDWTRRVPHLVQAVRGLGLGSAILDGEVVALESDGKSSFQGLQNAFAEKREAQLVYYVFDLLYLDGMNLFKTPLEQRKHALAQILGAGQGPLRDAGYIAGKCPEFFAEACKHHLEGIICKRRDRPFVPGRSADWIKVKCGRQDEFVIGGFTRPSGARIGFGALLLGYHDEQGRLRYAGRVGTGFGDKLLTELSARLQKIEQHESPFVDLQGRTGQARGVRWVKPTLVAQVTFGEWTRDGLLRHPSFQGLREDKKAADVKRERAVSLAKVKQALPPAQKESGSMSKSSSGKVATNGKVATSGAMSATLPGSIRLTHPDKVLYPRDGITKADVAGYYASIAEWMLPHLEDRPLTLVRCPQGTAGKCFYQKHADKGLPDEIGQVTIAEKRIKIAYPVVKNVEGLLALVQMNTLEIHAWGAKIDNVEKPDRLVFDLDPDPTVPWKRVVESAQQLRRFFEELDLTVFLKTTGGKGLHLVMPVQRRATWDEARGLCEGMARAVAAADPDRYTTNMSKAVRGGKIFIDYLRNARGATAVVAYSTRAREHGPISTPISWDELPLLKSASQFTLENVPQRLATLKRDPWREIATTRQTLAKSLWKKFPNDG